MKILLGLVASFFISSVGAQSVVGQWKTIDDETKQAKSVVEIYEKGGKYYGKVVKVLTPPTLLICEKCTDDRKNKPIMGIEIIRGLEKDGEEYEDGTILDPVKGKIYDCKIWVDEKDSNKLNVRGYVGLLYRTQTWYRY